jgi:hypothetical protein
MRERRAGKKLKMKDCGKVEEIGDFMSINPHEMEVMLEEEQQRLRNLAV